MLDLGRFPYINDDAVVTDRIILTAASATDDDAQLDFSVKYKAGNEDAVILANEATVKLYNNSTGLLIEDEDNSDELLITKGNEIVIVNAGNFSGSDLDVGTKYTIKVEIKVNGETIKKDIVVEVEPHADAIAHVKADKNDVDVTAETGESLDAVETDITLVFPETNGSTVTWESNDAAIVIAGTENDGDAITAVRPAYGDGNADVTLTATITKGGYSETKVFNITVLEQEPTDAELAFEAVNKATTVAEMRAALEDTDLGLNLTNYNALVSGQKDIVAQTVLNARPATGFADVPAIQAALDAAI